MAQATYVGERVTVNVPVDDVELEGELYVSPDSDKMIVFSHGSGSSRFSPRNNYVAKVLHEHKIGTLLIDLLTEHEDKVYETRFNIDLLTERLVQITNWLSEHPEGKMLKIGYFGSSTGAASALKAAAKAGDKIKTVISRGGRPDLAMPVLDQIQIPTLLIVGSLDEQVIELNRQAYQRLKGEKQLEIIPGAGHLFEEPGTLEKVAEVAAEWCEEHL